MTQRTTSGRRAKGSSSTGEVDDYLAEVPAEFRAALEKLRQTIKSVVPDAVEVISYRIPTFKHRGRPLVAFAAFKDHCSFFAMSTAVMKAHRADVKSYDTAKGTIHFTPDRPLPVALVRKLVKARIEENDRAATGARSR